MLKLTMRRPKERNYISALYPSDFVFVAVHMYSCVRVSLMTSLIYIRELLFSLLQTGAALAVGHGGAARPEYHKRSEPAKQPTAHQTR